MIEAHLHTSDELEREVNQFLVHKYGVSAAVQFFTRYRRLDGMDYTRDRKDWLPNDADGFDRMMSAARSEANRLKRMMRRRAKEGTEKRKK